MFPEEKGKGKSAAGTPRLHVGKQKDERVKKVSFRNDGEIKFCLNFNALFTHTEKSNE